MKLIGSDMVQGVQWLQGLGPMLCDWSKLSMEFIIDGKSY